MLQIEVELKNRIIQISLKKGRKILDMFSFAEEGDLTEKLLPSVDKLIQKNKLQIQDIQKMKVKSDLEEPFTSYRILKTIEKIWKLKGSVKVK